MAARKVVVDQNLEAVAAQSSRRMAADVACASHHQYCSLPLRQVSAFRLFGYPSVLGKARSVKTCRVRKSCRLPPGARGNHRRPSFVRRRPHWPVPESLAVCGLLVAVSVSVSVAWRTPLADGVNVTVTVQVVPGARLVQVLVCAKSEAFVPVI